MSGKFRLAIQYLSMPHENFNIDYFVMALEYNAYDIAFVLYSQYEDQIVFDY